MIAGKPISLLKGLACSDCKGDSIEILFFPWDGKKILKSLKGKVFCLLPLSSIQVKSFIKSSSFVALLDTLPLDRISTNGIEIPGKADILKQDM